MDVREKLVELLDNSPHLDTVKGYKGNDCTFEQGVDWLIAHGVTVQEWISVKNRLPEIPEGYAESPEPVLYIMKNTKTIYAGYYGEGGVWRDKYFRQYSDSRNGVDANDVTYWMYQCDLPQPPKGGLTMRLIDAEAFLKTEIDRCGSAPLVGTCTSDNQYLSDRLKKAPTIEAKPVVHGHWIEKEKYSFGIMYDCSLCDNRILDNGYSWNYCPNCGAKMDETVEENKE